MAHSNGSDEEMFALLRAIVEQRPQLSRLLLIMRNRLLTQEERESLRLAVAGELSSKGMTPEGVWLPYADRLEAAIDWLGHR